MSTNKQSNGLSAASGLPRKARSARGDERKTHSPTEDDKTQAENLPRLHVSGNHEQQEQIRASNLLRFALPVNLPEKHARKT